MEVTGGHILLIVLCLLVGTALIYAGTVGKSDLRLLAGGGYFVITGIAAGLVTMRHLLPRRAGAILTPRLIGKLVFGAAVGWMLLLVIVSFIR
jgi:hypothetical protein